MADETSTSTRFSIFVPSPKARINMGKPDLDAPFGYTGLSLQSDVHSFRVWLFCAAETHGQSHKNGDRADAQVRHSVVCSRESAPPDVVEQADRSLSITLFG